MGECPYPLEVLDFLHPRSSHNASYLQAAWPCDVRTFWVEDLSGLVALVRFLLRYVSLVLAAFGLVFNSIAFLILNTSPLNTTSLSVYLRVLAISDNGALLFNYTIAVLRSHFKLVNNFYLEHAWACESHKVTTELFCMLSAWLVVALTVERWLVIRCPFSVGCHCTVRTAVYITTAVGIILFSVALTKIWFAGFETDTAFGYDACILLENGWIQAIYMYVAAALWLPLVFISMGNIGILCEVWHSARKRSKLMGSDWEHEVLSETNKMTRLLLLLSATYIVALVPLGAVETFELYWDSQRKFPIEDGYSSWLRKKLLLKWTRGLCFFFYECNFTFNFFLYCLSGDRFRYAVHHWLEKKCLCKSLQKKNILISTSHQPPSVTVISRATSISSAPFLSEA